MGRCVVFLAQIVEETIAVVLTEAKRIGDVHNICYFSKAIKWLLENESLFNKKMQQKEHGVNS